MLQLTADTNDARSMTAALRTLKRKHISSGLAAALAASGDLDTAQQLAQDVDPGKINQFDAAYASRAQAQRTLGNTAAERRVRQADPAPQHGPEPPRPPHRGHRAGRRARHPQGHLRA
jgi:hypothetical protein